VRDWGVCEKLALLLPVLLVLMFLGTVFAGGILGAVLGLVF
jgi:hypothetical protein